MNTGTLEGSFLIPRTIFLSALSLRQHLHTLCSEINVIVQLRTISHAIIVTFTYKTMVSCSDNERILTEVHAYRGVRHILSYGIVTIRENKVAYKRKGV